ncbi:phosphatidate cytidylyltransferase [Polynucleobacter kasalickyi]|uniref:Phosphatidate cytidylyltransferase n=1 Tax=Polynucleobacter kasalickyi TaxID=1938817 RepID=A0A1W1ZCT2_9BURK|nr:phosphatidate cytidylyltransferase [Polynucleobacter kasalickyi]SMC46146.1 phosphatidate cytidylyltransferase [Polynucleobacter kasalickyi]
MLKARVWTAIVLLTLFGPILILLPALHLYISLIGILSIGAWEWGRLLWPSNKYLPIAYALLVGISLAGLLGQHQGIILDLDTVMMNILFQYPIYAGVALWLVVVPVILKKSLNFSLLKFSNLLSVLGFLIFISAFCSALVLRDQGRWLFLAVIGIVWCADIGAYFAGKKFGKNKLAINISPGKSWEGAFGGGLVVCLFILGVYLIANQPELNLTLVLLIGLFLSVMSVVGDLFESLMKRLAKVKDSSALLPGHGGVLDRIDAILPVLPLAALLFKVIS